MAFVATQWVRCLLLLEKGVTQKRGEIEEEHGAVPVVAKLCVLFRITLLEQGVGGQAGVKLGGFSLEICKMPQTHNNNILYLKPRARRTQSIR